MVGGAKETRHSKLYISWRLKLDGAGNPCLGVNSYHRLKLHQHDCNLFINSTTTTKWNAHILLWSHCNVNTKQEACGFLFFLNLKWISKLCRSNIFLSLPSEFKSETIKSSILQLLHGCTSQSLRTSDNKQVVHFSPPHQDLSFPRRHRYSHHSSRDLSSHLSACIWVGYWDVSLFIPHWFQERNLWEETRAKKHQLPNLLFTSLKKSLIHNFDRILNFSVKKRFQRDPEREVSNNKFRITTVYVLVLPL